MNAWAAFVLGIFVGATACAFVLSWVMAGARADRDLDIAIALKELDEQKSGKAE